MSWLLFALVLSCSTLGYLWGIVTGLVLADVWSRKKEGR